MTSVFDAWREQIESHERDTAALRGGHGHGHGHGHGGGHGQRTFANANRALDPHRTGDPILNGLFSVLGPDADILDVGGGAGRYALPLATRAKHVTVVEPSAESVELLTARAAEAGLTNVTAINEPWESAEAPPADVVLCSMVLHHVSDAAPFVARMQEYARERVVLIEMMEAPGSVEVPFFERVYGSAPTPLPSVPSVLDLLWAMDIFPDVTMLSAEPPMIDPDRGAALDQLRRRLGVEEGAEADERLLAAADDLLLETPAGFVVRGVAPQRHAMISWRPV